MKVYVCLIYCPCEGYNELDEVFSKEEDAIEWTKKMQGPGHFVDYYEMEVK